MMRAFAGVKRGRPKGVAANDNAAGTGRDHGTAELQMKRAQLVRGLDAAAGAHPLDLLLAKGWISAQEQAAGLRYAALYRRVLGRTDVSYGRLYDGLAGKGATLAAGDETELARAEARLRQAKMDLLRAGTQIARQTEAVSVFGTWPTWILAPRGQQASACGRLRAGLGALHNSFAGQRI